MVIFAVQGPLGPGSGSNSPPTPASRVARFLRRGQSAAMGKDMTSVGIPNTAGAALRGNGWNDALHHGISFPLWAVWPHVHCRFETNLSKCLRRAEDRHGLSPRYGTRRRRVGLATLGCGASICVDAAPSVHHPYGCFRRVSSRAMASCTNAARLVCAASSS
jgi:hypothetical protein